MSSPPSETTPLSTERAIGTEGDEICDGYEEMDSTEGLFIDGSAKRPREDIESLELPSMGDSRQRGKTGRKEFEPTRIAKSVVDKIEEMLETYIYSPPSTITNSIYWVQDPKCRYISAGSPEFQLAINNWQTKLSHWNFEEFRQFYKVQRHYLYRRGVHYHSIKNSFTHAKTWLEQQCQVATLCVYTGFQYSQQPIQPKLLMQLMSNVVNRREKKRFVVRRPPSVVFYRSLT